MTPSPDLQAIRSRLDEAGVPKIESAGGGETRDMSLEHRVRWVLNRLDVVRGEALGYESLVERQRDALAALEAELAEMSERYRDLLRLVLRPGEPQPQP